MITAEAQDRASKSLEGIQRQLDGVDRASKQAAPGVNQVGAAFGRLESAARTASLVSAGIMGILGGIGAACVKVAMDAVESENLFEVSMKGMAEDARKWSEMMRDQLGLNAVEVRKNVGTFNVMFKSMGIAGEGAYGMAKGLTQLSYDMSSFYNLRPDEA